MNRHKYHFVRNSSHIIYPFIARCGLLASSPLHFVCDDFIAFYQTTYNNIINAL